MDHLFFRLPGVMSYAGLKHSAIYQRIEKGVFPPPIKDGRAALWAKREIDAINAAKMAGLDDDQLRELVKDLVAERGQVFEHLRNMSA